MAAGFPPHTHTHTHLEHSSKGLGGAFQIRLEAFLDTAGMLITLRIRRIFQPMDGREFFQVLIQAIDILRNHVGKLRDLSCGVIKKRLALGELCQLCELFCCAVNVLADLCSCTRDNAHTGPIHEEELTELVGRSWSQREDKSIPSITIWTGGSREPLDEKRLRVWIGFSVALLAIPCRCLTDCAGNNAHV